MKISVIMPSRLVYYEGASSNRNDKFLRSVNSFLKNCYKDKELIIISDGCSITNRLYNEYYKDIENIKLIIIPRPDKSDFRGIVRHTGVNHSSGDIITFLDVDDEILPNHLDIIVSSISNNDWIYVNTIVRRDDGTYYLRNSELKHSYIGTGNISYKKYLNVSWKNCNNRGQDWKFISKILEIDNLKYEKIPYSGYVIRHLIGNEVNN